MIVGQRRECIYRIRCTDSSRVRSSRRKPVLSRSSSRSLNLREKFARSRLASPMSGLLLRRGRWLGRTGVRVTVFHQLFALGLRLVPLLLLVRVEKGTHLCICVLTDVHHLRPAILLRSRGILVQALHLGLFRLEDLLHFGLLISSEVQLLGQFLGTLRGILRAMVPPAALLGGLGFLVVGWAILSRDERRSNRDGAGRDEYKQSLLKHGNLLCEAICLYL